MNANDKALRLQAYALGQIQALLREPNKGKAIQKILLDGREVYRMNQSTVVFSSLYKHIDENSKPYIIRWALHCVGLVFHSGTWKRSESFEFNDSDLFYWKATPEAEKKAKAQALIEKRASEKAAREAAKELEKQRKAGMDEVAKLQDKLNQAIAKKEQEKEENAKKLETLASIIKANAAVTFPTIGQKAHDTRWVSDRKPIKVAEFTDSDDSDVYEFTVLDAIAEETDAETLIAWKAAIDSRLNALIAESFKVAA
jgi:hypothetical protein